MRDVSSGAGQPARRYCLPALTLTLLFHTALLADEYSLETPLLIRGATVIPRPGQLLDNASVLIANGVIQAVGPEAAPPAGARVIDGQGLYVYPGFIDAFTRVGLDDVKSTAAEERRREEELRSPTEGPLLHMPLGARFGMYPERDVLDVLDVKEETYAAHRSNGFTFSLVAPPAALFGGRAALLELGDDALRNSVVRQSAWHTAGATPPRGRALANRGRYPSTRMGVIAAQRQMMLDAQWYGELRAFVERHPAQRDKLPHDPSLVALQAVQSGKIPVLWEADSADEIDRVLAFADEFKLAAWIVGGRRAYERLESLARRNAVVIVSLNLPKKSADYELKPKLLRKARHDRSLFGNAWEARPFQPEDGYAELRREREEWLDNLRRIDARGLRWAVSVGDEPENGIKVLRECVKLGLSPDTALAALTTKPAALLGVEEFAGTIETGKRASLSIWDKPLADAEAKLRYTIVRGHVFERDSKEKSKGPGRRNGRERQQRPPFDEEPEFHCDTDEAMAGSRVGDSHSPMLAAPQAPPQPGQSPDDQPPPPAKPEDPLETTPVAPATQAADGTAASQPASQPVEEIPPGPLDVYLQHVPQWPIETDATRIPPLRVEGNVLLREATVLTVSQGTLSDCSILIQNGKIAGVGPDVSAPEGIQTINLRGYVVMPGVFDPHAHIALDSVNESSGSVTPEVRCADVINSKQRRIYDALAGGCTAIHAMHGSANTIGGQCVQLKMKYGKGASELLVADQHRTVKFATGENVKSSRAENTIDIEDGASLSRFPRSRMGVETAMRRAFSAGAEYLRKRVESAQQRRDGANPLPLRRDLRLEALADIIAGEIWINMHCYRADEVLRALNAAEDFGVRMAGLHHILEGYRIMPEIARHGASTATFSDWWAYKIEAYDAVPQNAGMLLRAGVNSTIKSDSADLMRHMQLEAAKCMASSNLTSDETLRLITLNAARMFGLEDRLGSIEVGKEADLAVFDGHPLDTFSRCVMTLVDGEIYFTHRDFDPLLPPAPQRPVITFFQDGLWKEHADEASWLKDGSGRMPPEAIHLTPMVAVGQVAPAKSYAIVNATLHPVSGPDIPNATIVLANDRIVAIGPAGTAPPDDAMVVDAAGLHVYPGLINAATRLGLQEIEAIPVTIDTQEIGRFQPDVFALSAFNPHSRLINIARSAGVLTANVIPSGPFVAGQCGLVQLDGWTLRDMILADSVGLVVRVPSLPPKPVVPPDEDDEEGDKERRKLEQRTAGRQRELRDFFENAQRYAAGRAAGSSAWPLDPRYEQMRAYVAREKPVLLHANSYKEILEALMFAEQLEIRPIILGGQQAWRIAPLLAEKGVPVIYEGVMALPDRFDEWDANYRAAARMAEAGVQFCFAHADADLAKQLASEAGFAVAHGLAPDMALRAITLSPAEILGVAGELGALEVGKLGNVLVTTGDILQATTRVVHAFVRGKPVSLENAHTQQADQFAERPAPDLPPARDDLRGPLSASTNEDAAR